MMSIIFSVISGFLLILCFPEHDFFWLTWIALVPFFIALMLAKKWWQAVLYGFITGVIFFGGILAWIKIVGVWIGRNYGLLAWMSLAVFQALFIVLFAFLFFILWDLIRNKIREDYREYFLFFLTPAVWIILEWLRALGPFAMAMGGLSYSQYLALPIIQSVSLVGIYGLSFLVVMVNFIIARIIFLTFFSEDNVSINWYPIKIIGAITISIFLANVIYGFYSISIFSKNNGSGKNLNVAIFQPNIIQEKKLNPKYFSDIKELFIAELKRVKKIQNPDLILWPETIVPELLLRDRHFIFQIKERAKTFVLFGTPTITNGNIQNSIILLNPQGKEQAFYHKKHLVPFGEYLPFKFLLKRFVAHTDFFNNDYAAGLKDQKFKTPWGNFVCGICFESILPQLIRPQVLSQGKLLVFITNDAWFKTTAGLKNHLALTLFRAIENRRFLIQVANTGISFIADPAGKIIQQSNINRQEWLVDKVTLIDDLSFYTRFGDIIVYISLIYFLWLIYQLLVFKYNLYKQNKLNSIYKEMNN